MGSGPENYILYFFQFPLVVDLPSLPFVGMEHRGCNKAAQRPIVFFCDE
jgi:hypothetical protein